MPIRPRSGRSRVVRQRKSCCISAGPPDDMAAAALGLSLGKMGNVRTQTLRAFDAAEVSKLLDKTV